MRVTLSEELSARGHSRPLCLGVMAWVGRGRVVIGNRTL